MIFRFRRSGWDNCFFSTLFPGGRIIIFAEGKQKFSVFLNFSLIFGIIYVDELIPQKFFFIPRFFFSPPWVVIPTLISLRASSISVLVPWAKAAKKAKSLLYQGIFRLFGISKIISSKLIDVESLVFRIDAAGEGVTTGVGTAGAGVTAGEGGISGATARTTGIDALGGGVATGVGVAGIDASGKGDITKSVGFGVGEGGFASAQVTGGFAASEGGIPGAIARTARIDASGGSVATGVGVADAGVTAGEGGMVDTGVGAGVA